ncbi:MAG: hypothetical protein J6B12_01610 [Clostridia bacterium]|nr:hypothetical protein [Clostridia bacterium]
MKEDFLTLENRAIEVPRGVPYNIVVFDASGRIITRVGTDTPFMKKENFFELLSPEETEFFHENSRAFGTRKLLLDSTRGPMLVFCSLFSETGVFAATVFHTARETVRDFWKYGFWVDTMVSPTLKAKTPPRKSGDLSELSDIANGYGYLTPLFDSGVAKLPLSDGDWMLSDLTLKICNLARSFGCEISLRRAGRVLLSESWVFSMPCFAAIMACLLSLAATSSVDGKAKVELFEEDGRWFVCFYTTLVYWRDKESKGHCCEYSELEACARIADRHDLLFDVVLERREENAALSVRLSPEYVDIAVLGFKNPIRFDG